MLTDPGVHVIGRYIELVRDRRHRSATPRELERRRLLVAASLERRELVPTALG
jgi:hypothetical protein